MRRLGIVGHRVLDAQAAAFVGAESAAVLARELAESPSVVALSALAEGADTLFAEAALAAHVPLDVIRPFDEYDRDFSTEPARKRYHGLVAAARRETRLQYRTRSPLAYEAAMKLVVETCDVLVAAWDGAPPRDRAGTAHAVAYASLIGRPIVHLDVTKRCVRFRGVAAP